jgi:hypothetical protein
MAIGYCLFLSLSNDEQSELQSQILRKYSTAFFKESRGIKWPDSEPVSSFARQRVHGMVFKYAQNNVGFLYCDTGCVPSLLSQCCCTLKLFENVSSPLPGYNNTVSLFQIHKHRCVNNIDKSQNIDGKIYLF